MKGKIFILTIFCIALQHKVFSQTLLQKKLQDKEAKEIAYIINCISKNRSVDSLIEWKLHPGDEGNLIEFSYKRSRLVFFGIHKDTSGTFLKSIDYYHFSFEKMIFLSDTLSKYEITSQTIFKVWMPKDKQSIYFCMINPNSITFWVLRNEYTVYSTRRFLSPIEQ